MFLLNFSPYPYQQCPHLDWPVPVWLGDTQVDKSGHRQAHVQPVAEAEVVNELEDVLHAQEDQPHQSLQAGKQKKKANAVFLLF